MRSIAIYLPQFHPIPENDAWWGKGFTEWTNVAKAKPLFKGHLQPRYPSDLGYYDLRVHETRELQAQIAKSYGIHGFAYYHYWFNGKRLLQRPVEEVLKTGQPDFPFCLFWANETWSRRWLGEERDVLMKQTYSHDDDALHIDYLLRVFEDQRYINYNGRPVFIVYRPADLPTDSRFIEHLKNESVKRIGHEPFLIASDSHCWNMDQLLKLGYDAVLHFRPQLGVLPNAFNESYKKAKLVPGKLRNIFKPTYKHFTYLEALHRMQAIEPADYRKSVPSVFVGWDNTARRGQNAIVVTENNPALFQQELRRIIRKINQFGSATDFVFINAWNEWAEGNYLEPDLLNGFKFLEAVKDVLRSDENAV